MLILADAAQVDQGGKIHLLGGGWTVTSAPAAAHAVVVLVSVPWTEANRPHHVALSLVDEDGGPVVVGQGPDGEMAVVRVENEIEVGRPAGVPEGVDLNVPLAINIGEGLPLTPNRRYQWRLEIDGEHREEWQASFHTRPGGPAAGGPADIPQF